MSEMTPTSAAAFETLRRFLDEDEWHPEAMPDKPIFRMAVKGRSGRMLCFAQIRGDIDQFVFYAVSPITVPEERREQVAEFLTRANYGMRIGNFEMDFGDGEVRYKSALDYEKAELTPALIRNAIYPATQMMDRYLNGLMSVLTGAKTPLQAVTEVEAS